jgi:starch synthase
LKPVRIALVASEVAPYAKSGGLADVAGALSRYLARQGHDVRLFVPFYGQIDTAQNGPFVPVDFLRDVPLRLGRRSFRYTVFTRPDPDRLGTYFLHCPELYHRESLYTSDPDEHLRFAFLSRAAVECCQRMGWSPQVIHTNDWHTGLLPLYLKRHYQWDRLFATTRTVLTIHNIGYQGVFGAEVLPELELEGCADLLYQEDLHAGRINFLKTGLLYADVLTTVSRTYAREIQTAEYGMGLEDILRRRAGSLVGIVNGVDYGDWNPSADPYIPHPYSVADLSGKAKNKRHLLDAMGLSFDEEVPVLGLVSRLVHQKGFDLLFDILPDLLARRDVRLTFLGSGEAKYARFFAQLQQAFPTKMSYYKGYSEELAHLIEAGADIFLMPSRYEPCGLNQMYSLRYGTVPVVRKTGGLADTVQLWNPSSRQGTGFVFDHFTTDGLRWALHTALDTYRDRDAWRTLQENGMKQDFSWEVQGQEYEALYRRLVG